MGILFEVLGLDPATVKLVRMGERAPREIKNAAKRNGTLQARAIKAAMKRRRTGLLYKSIGSKVKEGRKGYLTTLAGPRRGFRVKIADVLERKLVAAKTHNDKKITLKKGRRLKAGDYLDPVRYAHLANKKQRFMEAADKATRQQVIDSFKEAVKASIKG